MLRILPHIEQLLLMHDCVIIPKIGGFVLQSVAASYVKESHRFCPMRKEVVFNPTLQHNDGLLAESYMRTYGLDFKHAQQWVEEDIDALEAALERDRRISLGRLGSFVLGEEGQLVFETEQAQTLAVDAYGLEEFCFPALRLGKTEFVRKEHIRPAQVRQIHTKSESPRPVVRRFMPRRLLRVAGAVAAAIGLFFLISTPVKEVNRSAYTASFVPTEMVPLSKEINRKNVEKKVQPTQAVKKDVEVEKSKPALKEVKQVTPVPRKAESPVVARKAAKTSGKQYHIVIASFPTEAQANEYLKKVDRKVCRGADKVANGGKYRIYAAKYDNRSEAEAYLAQLRKKAAFKDAWLFISR